MIKFFLILFLFHLSFFVSASYALTNEAAKRSSLSAPMSQKEEQIQVAHSDKEDEDGWDEWDDDVEESEEGRLTLDEKIKKDIAPIAKQ